jgi:hypothetical protein
VPTSDIAECKACKEKAARRRLLNSNLMIVNQTAVNAGFDPARLARRPPSNLDRLERFQAKWIPVRVKKTRQNKKTEPRSDTIG